MLGFRASGSDFRVQGLRETPKPSNTFWARLANSRVKGLGFRV